MLCNSGLWHQAFQCSPHVQKPQPQAEHTGILCNAWGELTTPAGVHKCLQHEEKGKAQGHFNHGAKSLATKHRPEIILREFIG